MDKLNFFRQKNEENREVVLVFILLCHALIVKNPFLEYCITVVITKKNEQTLNVNVSKDLFGHFRVEKLFVELFKETLFFAKTTEQLENHSTAGGCVPWRDIAVVNEERKRHF